jgi:hypothetical protein
MPPKAQALGPGTFSIGEVGTALDLTAQVTSIKLTPSVNQDDPTPTLSGEDLPGDRVYSWTINGTLLQDLTEDGMFDYCLAHKGQSVPFTFVPSTAAGRSFSGVATVDPLEVGGDVKKKNTTDFEWSLVGDPTLGADL